MSKVRSYLRKYVLQDIFQYTAAILAINLTLLCTVGIYFRDFCGLPREILFIPK